MDETHAIEPESFEVERGVWPTVLGVIAIVFGVLGALANAWSAYGAIFNPAANTAGFPTEAGRQAAQAVVARFAPISAPLAVVGVLLSLMLLVAGVALIRRHPDAVRLARLWAVIKIVVSIVGWGVAFLTFRAMEPVIREHIPQGAGVAIGFQRVFVVVGLLWTLALPVFVLLWTGRGAVREQVRTWD